MVYSASFDITLDPGDTGLTLKSQIFDTVGAQVGADRTTGFVEVGGGAYTQVITDIPDGQRGSVRFLDGATFKAHVSLNPEELENTDSKTSAVKTDTAAIKTKTDTLPVSPERAAAIANFKWVMFDSTDHVTAKTGLTITAQISKDGGAFAGIAGAVVEIGNGVYKIPLTAGDMTADDIMLKFTATGADDRLIYIRTDS